MYHLDCYALLRVQKNTGCWMRSTILWSLRYLIWKTETESFLVISLLFVKYFKWCYKDSSHFRRRGIINPSHFFSFPVALSLGLPAVYPYNTVCIFLQVVTWNSL